MRGPQGSDLPPPTSSTCGQCGHRFPYLEDVGLEIAEYILEQHAQLCPRSSSQKRAQVALWPEAGTSKMNTLSAADQVGSQGGAAASETLDTVKKRRKYETDMMGRKAVLEADSYGRDVTAKSIVCNGCDKTIRLDRRNDYYPGLWVKHRDKCRARAQPSKVAQAPLTKQTPTDVSYLIPPYKRATREAAKEVVWGEKVGVGGKRKTTTRARTAKPGASLRARTLSPTQGNNFEPSIRPRSWSGVSVPGTSARPIPPGDQAEGLPHAGPLSLLPDDFRERGSSGPILVAVTHEAHRKHTGTPHPPHAGPVPLLEAYDFLVKSRPRSSSIESSAGAPSVGSSHTTHVDTSHILGRSYETDTHTLSWTEEGDGDEDVKSDRYWSEAPFATGPDQWAERGRYRYSTRRELMRVFQQHRKEVFDEEMPEASPSPASDDCSSPGYVELRELHDDGC